LPGEDRGGKRLLDSFAFLFGAGGYDATKSDLETKIRRDIALGGGGRFTGPAAVKGDEPG
jgi:hypothetical protein